MAFELARDPSRPKNAWRLVRSAGRPAYRESLRTLALFYIRLYRVLTLSAIEDTHIEDTPSWALTPGIPTLLLFHFPSYRPSSASAI